MEGVLRVTVPYFDTRTELGIKIDPLKELENSLVKITFFGVKRWENGAPWKKFPVWKNFPVWKKLFLIDFPKFYEKVFFSAQKWFFRPLSCFFRSMGLFFSGFLGQMWRLAPLCRRHNICSPDRQSGASHARRQAVDLALNQGDR